MPKMSATHLDVITVTLDGKPRNIKLSVGALRIGELLGKLQVDLNDPNAYSATSILHLAYIGLLVDEPELDEMQVMKWIVASGEEAKIQKGVTAQLNYIAQSFEELNPEGEDEEDGTAGNGERAS